MKISFYQLVLIVKSTCKHLSKVKGKLSFSCDRYFKTKDGLYGLSCFERIAVDNVAERGARMKSVGILCAKYTSLHEHMSFLEEEVR